MKIGIIHPVKCDNSLVVSAKIARYLRDKTGGTIIDRLGMIDTYDTLMYINGAFWDLKLIAEIAEIVSRCKKFILIHTDYTLKPRIYNELLKGNMAKEVWSTIPTMPTKYVQHRSWGGLPVKATHYINWNMLTFDLQPLIDPVCKRVLYYGAFRQGREELFSKYMSPPLPYPLTVSATKTGREKFEDLNVLLNVIPPAHNLSDMLRKYAMTLYLEDEKSNRLYCSPANRFYESLGAGVAMVFDESSIWTFEQAGYDISPFVVKNKNEVANAFARWPLIRQIQRSDWGLRDYRSELDTQVSAALQTL